jgi:predicted nucleic acid-binding protein
MMYYAVLDTNVLVSALLKNTSNPGQVVAEALCGRIIPVLNDENTGRI